MKLNIKAFVVLGLVCLGMNASPMQAQIGKLKGVAGKAKSKATSKAKSTVKNDASGGAAATQRLESKKNNLKDLDNAPNWGDAEYVKKYQYALGHFSEEVAKAQNGGGTDRVAGKKYAPIFAEFETKYQSNVPLQDQKIYPLESDFEKRKEIKEVFRKAAYPFSRMKKKEGQDKAMWGDAEWVEEFGKSITEMKAGISTYRAADPSNSGKIERYEEALVPLEKLYNDRKTLPGKRAEASKFMQDRKEHYRVLLKAQKGEFSDGAAFLEAVKGWDFPGARKQVAFLNEWGFKVMGDDLRPDDLRTFTMNWPGEVKSSLEAQMDASYEMVNNHKYEFVQYQSALRFKDLVEGGGILYPEDKAATAKVEEVKTLIPAKKKAYEAATFTSDYHKNHTYEIGFSATGANGFSAKNKIAAGEKFVMTIFFDRPIALIFPEGSIAMYMKGHCDEKEDLRFKLAGADLDKSYFDFEVFGKTYSNERLELMNEEILRELVRAKGSTKEVTFETAHMSNTDTRQICKGGITFDGTNMAGIGKYDVRRVAMTDKRLVNVRMPKAGMTNAQVALQMKNAFMGKYGDDDVVAVKKVVITGTDWTVRRNELTGIIVSRFVDATVSYERIDGTCRMEDVRFTQSAQGGGKYGPCYWDGVGDNDEISCKYAK